MADTKIEWADAVWNPVVGCTKVSNGCIKCFAEKMARRLAGMSRADRKAGRNPGRKANYEKVIAGGRWNGGVVCDESALTLPLHWKKPRTIFVCSMGDLFHKDVPFEFIDKVWAVMALCPQHTFMVLTKRLERMAEYTSDRCRPFRVADAAHVLVALFHQRCITDEWGHTRPLTNAMIADGGLKDEYRKLWPLPHVLLGTSCEDQPTADERILHLLRCPAVGRFVSLEPLLEGVDLRIKPTWVHPEPGENASDFCRRMGWGPGGVLLHSVSADGKGIPDNPRRYKLLRLDTDTEHKSCNVEMDCGHIGSPSMVMGGLRTGSLVSDPVKCWPWAKASGIDHVIIGGESGAGARACNVEWIRSLIAQAKAAGVSCFVKQLGAMPYEVQQTGGAQSVTREMALDAGEPAMEGMQVGEDSFEQVAIDLKHSKGANPDEWPADLRVREMPDAKGRS